MEIKEKLREFGFSDKEVTIYLALVKIGASAASDVAKKAGINRSTTYVVLDSLSKRGLVTTSERRGVKLFAPAPAESLINHLNFRAKEYSSFAGVAKKLLPELKALHKKTQKDNQPRVQLFEGVEGIRAVQNVYEEALSSLESIRANALQKDTKKAAGVSAKRSSTMSEITVHQDKIILVSPEEKFAAVVESKKLASELKQILRSAKKEARKTGEKRVPKPRHATNI